LCLEAQYRYTPLYGLGFEPDPKGPNPNVLDSRSLPKDLIFRHAKHLKEFSSPSDEMAPVITDHGDFIYFTSAREGGFGGSDIYRSRISGEAPSVPANLGKEVNSKFNETNPAIRMAGFHLLFNSDRKESISSLYGTKSKRVMIDYDYSKMPSMAWVKNNLVLLGSALTLFMLFIFLFIRAFKRTQGATEENDEVTQASAK
jgi:hypothetical protein